MCRGRVNPVADFAWPRIETGVASARNSMQCRIQEADRRELGNNRDCSIKAHRIARTKTVEEPGSNRDMKGGWLGEHSTCDPPLEALSGYLESHSLGAREVDFSCTASKKPLCGE